MITEKELREMEIDSTKDDEYDGLTWGSKKQVQRLLKEVRRLNEKLDAQHGDGEQ